MNESRPKLRKLRNQKQRRIYSPRLKWLAPDKLVKYSFCFWNLSHVRALDIFIFRFWPGAPGY